MMEFNGILKRYRICNKLVRKERSSRLEDGASRNINALCTVLNFVFSHHAVWKRLEKSRTIR